MPSDTTNGHSAGPKVVVVTGGASGIGLAMTRHFASEGHHVAVLDVNEHTGPQIAADVASEFPKSAVSFRKCDVSSWPEQAAVFAEIYQEHGRIDYVMANAGISEQGLSSLVAVEEDMPLEPALRTLNVNLVGVIYTVKLAIHYMNKNKEENATSRGSIICTASNAGFYPFPVAPLYAASKAGVIALVRSMAKPLEKANIQINALAPAVLETNIAPDKALFKEMIVTPMSTLVRGVKQIIAEGPALTGTVAEIHGDHVTLRAHLEYVDDDSKSNLEKFWQLGYA